MELPVLFLLTFLINLGCVVSELSLRFVFIIESNEPELSREISRALKYTEDNKSGLLIIEDTIRLDRENEEESYNKCKQSVADTSFDKARAKVNYRYITVCAFISKGVSAIIDLSWAPWELAEQLSESAGVPIIHTLLGAQQLVSAWDSYLESRNATDAAYLVENESDVDITLYELLGRSHVRVWVHAGLTRDSARALKSMRPEPNFFVIVGDEKFVVATYKRAVKEKLVKRNYRWNIVLTDYKELDPSMLVLPTIILQPDAGECCKLVGLKEDCSCPSNMQRRQLLLNNIILYTAESFLKLDADQVVNIDCENSQFEMNITRDKLYEIFGEDSANNDSLLFWDEERIGLFLRSRFILSSYKPDSGMERVALWPAHEEYKLLPGVELEPLRNFFRIGTSPAVPWTLVKFSESGEPLVTEDGQPVYEGYCIDLIDKIAEQLGFDYEIITPKTGTFGMRLPNGSWDGIIGNLMTGETDIAVAALTMTAEREEVVDFVAPYFEQTGILIVIRKPIRKTSLFKFMTVLRTEVWLSIVAALLLTGFMIWLLEKYSPYSARNNPGAYPYPCREFTLKESFWFALTSFTPQGGGEAPKALSGRTLVAAYWLFVVLMLATFTANLAAFLTVERMQTPVSSLEQLARQSRINYTVVEGSTIHQYFINMKFAEDTLYRVWKEITLNATSDQSQYRVWDYPIREQYGHILLAINASGPVTDAQTGFEQVNEHSEADFAFIHDSAEIKYEITRNCNLTEVGEVFAEQPYALAVSAGSRLQEELSRALLDLQKERFLEQLSAKYWNESARQACPDADESEGITLESLGGVFIATLFGLGLAMITLAWEVFYYKRKEKNKITTIDKREAFEPKKIKLSKKITEGVTKLRKRKKPLNKSVTIGDTFKPADGGVSFINVYPKYNP